jgi:enoyl-CoA hydratase
VIAALPGLAIGGGAELAVACDLRIAHPSVRISFKQVRLGVTTAWGTVARLVALVGAGATARLVYSARDVSAEEAKEIGLVDSIEIDPLAEALVWAGEIAKGSPSAVRDMKRLVRAASVIDVRALERELFVAGWSGADHVEAVEAFFARRPPRWQPR